jgi:SagB-type dehydrogenase family enzyme
MIHVAGIMKSDTVVIEPHTVLVNPDGGWFIQSGWTKYGSIVDSLSTMIVAAGLRDAHTHIWGNALLPHFPLFGITEVRDLGSPAEVRVDKSILHPDCSHPYPRLVFGGPMLHRSGSPRLASAARWNNMNDIHEVLHQAVKAKACWQKLYSGFPDQYIPSTIQLAHELGLRVAIHPRAGGATFAISADVDEIEHVACLAWDLASETPMTFPSTSSNQHIVHRANEIWANEALSIVSPERFLKTALCPTLVVQQELLNAARSHFQFPGIPNWLTADWKRLSIARPWTDQQIAIGEIALKNMIRFVGRFVNSGGVLSIGSDTPNPGVLPGRSLWQELELLYKAGLPPLDLYHRASVYPEGLPDNGNADLVFLSQERVLEAVKGGSWRVEPVSGVLLRGCLYLVDSQRKIDIATKEKVSMTDVRYRRSKHLLLMWGDNNRLEVVHIPTSHQYRLDPIVVTLLNTMSQPKTLTELTQAVPELADQLPVLLDKLSNTGLIQTIKSEFLEDSPAPTSIEDLWSAYELATHFQASTGKVREPLTHWPAPSTRKEVVSDRRISLSSVISSHEADISHLSVSEALRRRRSIRHYADDPLGIRELALFLMTSARVFDFIGPERYQATHRPSPSAGGRHSLELYILCKHVENISPGVYYYDPFANELAELETWNSTHDDMLTRLICKPAMLRRHPDVAIYITSVVGRVFWKYVGSGLVSIYRDTGCLMQTMYLVATDLALAPCAIAAIDRPPLPSFVKAQSLEEIHVGSFALSRPVIAATG